MKKLTLLLAVTLFTLSITSCSKEEIATTNTTITIDTNLSCFDASIAYQKAVLSCLTKINGNTQYNSTKNLEINRAYTKAYADKCGDKFNVTL